jgi:hypothetical protein
VCDDGQAVTRRNERVRAVDHVAVAIAITGSAEVDAVLVDRVDERLGVYEVGVGVVAAEVGLGDAVLCAVGDAELLLEDVDTVGASDTAEAVEEDLEVRVLLEERLDEVEVEDVLEHLQVVLGGVQDLDLEVAILLRANLAQVDVWDVGDLVRGEGLGGLVDLVGNALGCRCTVGEVVLDAKVLSGACSQSDDVLPHPLSSTVVTHLQGCGWQLAGYRR